jgi:FxsC-like protein
VAQGKPSDSRASPYFFLSYAHNPPRKGDDPDRWVHQLYRDLCDDIINISAASADSVGFMDREMQSGTEWQRKVSDALGNCRVFVPLYSPRYFTSEWCGREWYAFSRRTLEHAARNGNATPTIIPALWASVDVARLPEVAQNIQFDHRAFGLHYSQEGFYGIMKLGRYRTDYKKAVLQLARKIVEVAEGTRIEPMQFDELGALPSSFGTKGESENDRPRIRITVAAPDRQTLPFGREPLYYGPSARDWKPFHPEAGLPLVNYAAQLASCLGFQATVSTLDGELNIADVSGEPGLFLVDAWGTLGTAERQRLQELDQHAESWVSIMVPWNHEDSETMEAQDRLKESLHSTLSRMLGRVPPKYRMAGNGIPTLRAFGEMLPLLAYHVGRRYLRNASAHPPAGTAPERPRLIGPVVEDSGGSA